MSKATHAERVAAAVPADCKVVALLHDAIEDGHVDAQAAADSLSEQDACALLMLTREPGVTYRDYIEGIAAWPLYVPREVEGRRIAITVKIADLRDNLYGRPEGPPPGDLADRYTQALAVLDAAPKGD